jgi:hypothetical protein
MNLIRQLLLDIRAWIREIQNAIQEQPKTGHQREEIQRGQNLPRDKIRAIVSFDDETVRNANAQSEKQHTTQEGIRKATVAAVVAAGIYALISILVWCQMIKQNTIASVQLRQSIESFRMDERAWVELEPIQGVPFTPKDAKFGASFRYPISPKNVGKTVATNVQLRALRNGIAGSREMGDDAKQISWLQDQLLLGKVTNESPTMPLVTPIPQTIAPQTESPVPVLLVGQEPQPPPNYEYVSYIVGRIDYTDAFSVSHWKKFCYFVSNYRGELMQCQEGNDEDKNAEGPN